MADASEPDPIELAWAAGFFDGEGYIAFRYNKAYNFDRHGFERYYRQIQVQVSQIDPQVLARFQRAVGVGSVTGPYKTRGRRQPMWKFSVGGYPSSKQVFDRLKPYLSPIKLEQAFTAFHLYDESPSSYTVEVGNPSTVALRPVTSLPAPSQEDGEFIG